MNLKTIPLTTVVLLLAYVAAGCGSLTVTPTPTPTQAPASLQPTVPVSEPVASAAQSISVGSPPPTAISEETGKSLQAVCSLDSVKLKVSCQAIPSSQTSELKWLYEDMDSRGSTFEFSPYPTTSQIRISLKECMNSSCQEVEVLIDASHLEATKSGRADVSSIRVEVKKPNTKLKKNSQNRTMQSEYSQGRCNPKGMKYLDSPPMNTAEVTYMKPMGTFGGDHITPIDHMYVNYEPGTSHDVFAMGDGYIVHIGHTGKDHRVIIEYSCDLYSIYIHIHELDPDIEAQLEWVDGNQETKGRSYPRIPVKSGTKIGRQTGNQSFDLSVVDTSITLTGFVNLESYRGEFWKYHSVDPYDYWKGSFRQELLDKTIIVNEDSLGGKIDYDVDGKLIGNWFEEGTGGYSGERTDSDIHGTGGHLAIVYSVLVPNKTVISFGSFDGGGSALFFLDDSAVDPADVGPSTGLVQFELWGKYQGPDRDGNCCDTGFEVANTGERWFGDTYPKGGLVVTFHDHPGAIALVEMLDERTIKLETFATWDEVLERRITLDEISGFTDKFKIYKR